MKNQYKIMKYSPNGDLFYNEDYNFFSEKFGTIYTNKRKAENKAEYAKKYVSSTNDKIEVIPIN